MKADTRWLIGCSGFSYKDWKPVFYPSGLAPAKWLRFYAEHFETLESNTTFYRMPQIKTLNKWFDDTPDDFVFSVKAPRLITHYKKMAGTKEMITAFYDLMLTGLQHKLGAVLFQFPPGFSFTQERLAGILEQLDGTFTNVVEFRHSGWWNASVYQALQEKNITFCGISHPKLPDEVVDTTPNIYFRFHGVPELYTSSYTHQYLDKIYTAINKLRGIKNIYLYFNNTIAATAIENAEYLLTKLLSEKKG